MASLTWASITAASRVMLPVYPVLAGWQGCAYAFGGPNRTNTPSLQPAKELLPIQGWGSAFLILAALMVAGYAMRSRDVTVFVLYSACMAYGLWSLAFWFALATVPDASWMGPAWPMFAAVCCGVSATSVGRHDVSVRGEG